MHRQLRLAFVFTILCILIGIVSALEAQTKPILTASIPRTEACITVLAATQLDASSPTVSLSSMLVPSGARHAYEHAYRALEEHNFGTAQKELTEAVLRYPKSAVAWCLMGALREGQGHLDEAVADYSKALSADKQLLPAYLGLARIAFRRENWQEVAKFTDQVVKVNPKAFPGAHHYNAAANFNRGDLAAAERSARTFQSLDVQHECPQAYLLLGRHPGREA